VGEVALEGRPRAIAVGPDGTAYVAVRRSGEGGAADHVAVIGPDGRVAARWPDLGPRSLITGIAATDGHVFLANAGERVVLDCDPSGRVLRRIGETGGEGEGGEGFKVPSPYFDLAVGPGKVLWIVNPGRRRVEAWSFEGCAGFWWGRASPAIEDFSGCCNPAHLAIGPDGTFVTAEKGLVRVKTYTAEGRFRSVVAPPAAFAKESGPPDVAMDSAGRVLVLDPGARTVRVFAPRAAAAGKEP
jgi:DNA-binding beta-propeller fold protein YncE